MLNKKIIWMPEFYDNCDFGIYLNRNFAKEMIKSKIPTERQTIMNKLATQELKRRKVNWINPYSFHEDTAFIHQIYIGQNGVWLSTNHQDISELISETKSSKQIKYESHNVDFPEQNYILMSLFNQWVEYSDAIRND